MLHATYTLTANNKYQCWDPTHADVLVLNAYIVYDDQLYLNNLNACTSCTVHQQDSVVVRHKSTNYIHVIACMLYSM